MRKYLKSILALFLCLVLGIGNRFQAQAANESNDRSVSFSTVLSSETITTSTENQYVYMYLRANTEISVNGIGFVVTHPDELEFTAVTGGEQIGAFSSTDVNLTDGTVGWSSSDLENITGVTELAIITLMVPANTAAGTYTVGVKDLELTEKVSGDTETTGTLNIWESTAAATATLTIIDGEQPAASGYSAGISADTMAVNKGETVSVNVAVSHESAEEEVHQSSFNAGKVVLNYDKDKLSYKSVAAASPINTAEESHTDIENDTAAGLLTLTTYGADLNFGEAYVVTFDTIAVGAANVELESAAFTNKTDAETKDLNTAVCNKNLITFTINTPEYNVTLPTDSNGAAIVEGAGTVTEGNSYQFTVKNTHFIYVFEATAGGESVTVESADGINFTVDEVKGDLVITLKSQNPKSYSVTIEGSGKDDVKAADGESDAVGSATYNDSYTFAMPLDSNEVDYEVSITIGTVAYEGFTSEAGTVVTVYTIPGTAITGDIVITVTKKELEETEVGVTIPAGIGASGAETAEIGQPYVLTVDAEAGYIYGDATVTMNGGTVTLSPVIGENGLLTYTIDEVTGAIAFNIARSVDTSGVSVAQYVQLDGTVMRLVTNTTAVADGKVPTYAGNKMFWSSKYNAYCYLVVADTLAEETAKAALDITEGTASTIDYDNDINETVKVDASDAQLVYNMYMAQYADFTEDVTVIKFLEADVNGDKTVDTTDAAAIISAILGAETN